METKQTAEYCVIRSANKATGGFCWHAYALVDDGTSLCTPNMHASYTEARAELDALALARGVELTRFGGEYDGVSGQWV